MLTYRDIMEKGEKRIGELGLYDEVIAGVETEFNIRYNRRVFERYVFEQAAINAESSDTGIEVFGKVFETPVMTAAIASPIPRITEKGVIKVAEGLKRAGSMLWLGWPMQRNLEEIVKIGVPVGQIIKPKKNRKEIYEDLEFAESSSVTAVGIDVDSGARTKYGGIPRGPVSAPLTTRELKDVFSVASRPFVLKGILSKRDAEEAMKVGVKYVIVSNHGAHAIDYLPHPLDVLPEILPVLSEDARIFVDSGFRRGTDVLKGLAFGADAVMIGRPILYALAAYESEGVEALIKIITSELRRVMTMTGVKKISEVNNEIIRTVQPY
jgi:4-hydroxymandelate oxidase